MHKSQTGEIVADQPAGNSIAALLELAITTENAAQKLYLGLAQQFEHLAPVRDFWLGMMQDEMAHARGLLHIRQSLAQEQLYSRADPAILEQARRVARLPVEETLQSLMTLEQAYQFTHELEYSEMNTIFEFIVSEFIAEERQKQLVLSQLREHITRLKEFPEAFRVLGDRPGAAQS